MSERERSPSEISSYNGVKLTCSRSIQSTQGYTKDFQRVDDRWQNNDRMTSARTIVTNSYNACNTRCTRISREFYIVAGSDYQPRCPSAWWSKNRRRLQRHLYKLFPSCSNVPCEGWLEQALSCSLAALSLLFCVSYVALSLALSLSLTCIIKEKQACFRSEP